MIRILPCALLCLLVTVPAHADFIAYTLYARDTQLQIGTASLFTEDGKAAYGFVIDNEAVRSIFGDDPSPRITHIAFNSTFDLDPALITVPSMSQPYTVTEGTSTDGFDYEIVGEGFNTALTVRIEGLPLDTTTAAFLDLNPTVQSTYLVDSPFGVGLFNGLGQGTWAYANPAPPPVEIQTFSALAFSLGIEPEPEPEPTGVPEPSVLLLTVLALCGLHRQLRNGCG